MNTKDINRDAPGNKDQKSTKESTNQQATNNYTTLSRESRNSTSPSSYSSDMLSRLK